jgi:HNH endonuclease
LQHITIISKEEGYKEYYITMMRNGVRKSKGYPYTEEGLRLAKDLVAKWQEDFSYDPERTTQSQRHRRANLHTATSIDTGPHVDYVHPVKEEEVPNFDNVAVVPLNKGQYTIVSIEDADKANTYSWIATINVMGGYYAMRRTETGGSIYLHRYLLDAPDGMVVDHINHNTLDNRRQNLRICTNQENNENRNGAYTTSKTGIRGVSVHKCRPSNGLMYTFRCHCVNCKASKFFPYTEEGLEAARLFAEAHYAAMKK